MLKGGLTSGSGERMGSLVSKPQSTPNSKLQKRRLGPFLVTHDCWRISAWPVSTIVNVGTNSALRGGVEPRPPSPAQIAGFLVFLVENFVSLRTPVGKPLS